jgi:hypothetical protein
MALHISWWFDVRVMDGVVVIIKRGDNAMDHGTGLKLAVKVLQSTTSPQPFAPPHAPNRWPNVTPPSKLRAVLESDPSKATEKAQVCRSISLEGPEKTSAVFFCVLLKQQVLSVDVYNVGIDKIIIAI